MRKAPRQDEVGPSLLLGPPTERTLIERPPGRLGIPIAYSRRLLADARRSRPTSLQFEVPVMLPPRLAST